MKKRINYPPLKRDWYRCPICGAKLAIKDNTTRCENLYLKCRVCKNEVTINI